jgi:ribosomal protein S18 acetylase RimI-like enzyme
MIRTANKNDLEAILEIENKMFNEKIYFRLIREDISKLLNKKSTRFFLAINEQNQVVGYSLGIDINKRGIWFNSLAVLKEYQNGIYAKELFLQIENSAKEQNFDSVILEIRQDNRALLRRYKNMGYQIWKNIENYYPDGVGAYRMFKCLNNKS